MNGKSFESFAIGSRATVTVLLGLLLLAPAASAQETRLEMRGGPGGNPERADCAPGSYVVGFKGQAGDWMNQISIVCGRWNEKTQTLQSAAKGKVSDPFGDSTDGDALSESCPEGWAVSAYQVRVTRENREDKFLHAIRFYCRPAIAGSGQEVHQTLGSWSKNAVLLDRQSCPPRELVTGMHGRAGLFVDALGLICNLRPEPAAVGIETKPSGNVEGPPGPVEETELNRGPIAAPGPIEGTELEKGPIAATPDESAPPQEQPYATKRKTGPFTQD